MYHLTAQYEVELPNFGLFVYRDFSEPLRYKTKYDDFSVKVTIAPTNRMPEHTLPMIPEKEFTQSDICGSHKLSIYVTGQERKILPLKDTGDPEKNNKNYYRYFLKRIETYSPVASIILDRIIRYFKYRLHYPYLSSAREFHKELVNPSWFDQAGNTYGPFLGIYQKFPVFQEKSFGIRFMKLEDDRELELSLENPINTKLYEELLADAQTAIYEENYRRGVLEMAIACEVAVKQFFFGRESVASEAFEFLENSRKVHVSVIELMDGAAKQAFGESFKNSNKDAFIDIENLFRCRNKVAHRGELWFADRNGVRREVDINTLQIWWNALEDLLIWIDSHQTLTHKF